MALQPDDLLYPKGALPLNMFPDKGSGNSAYDALTEWLEQADALVQGLPLDQQDAASRLYCYLKAYRMMAHRIAATPNSTSDNGAPMSVNRSWGEDRVEYWEGKARDAEDAFNLLIFGRPTGRVSSIYSGPIRNIPSW